MHRRSSPVKAPDGAGGFIGPSHVWQQDVLVWVSRQRLMPSTVPRASASTALGCAARLLEDLHTHPFTSPADLKLSSLYTQQPELQQNSTLSSTSFHQRLGIMLSLDIDADGAAVMAVVMVIIIIIILASLPRQHRTSTSLAATLPGRQDFALLRPLRASPPVGQLGERLWADAVPFRLNVSMLRQVVVFWVLGKLFVACWYVGLCRASVYASVYMPGRFPPPRPFCHPQDIVPILAEFWICQHSCGIVVLKQPEPAEFDRRTPTSND